MPVQREFLCRFGLIRQVQTRSTDREMRRAGVLIAFCATLAATALAEAKDSGGVKPPQTIYSVQVTAYPTLQHAQVLASKLQREGVEPVFTVTVEPLTKVRVGRLPDYPSALLVKHDLKKADYADCLIHRANTGPRSKP